MAKEIKSFNVPPSAEEDTINLWQSFGWELKSTQEVKTQDVQTFTGQDNDGTEHYKTTSGEHYIKLTFEREKSMPHYAELCELERTYNSRVPVEPKKPYPPDPPEKRKAGCCSSVFVIVAILIGISLIAVGIPELEVVPLCIGVISIIAGIAIVVILIKTNSKRQTEWVARNEEWKKEHAIWEKEHSNWKKILDESIKNASEAIERAKSLLE